MKALIIILVLLLSLSTTLSSFHPESTCTINPFLNTNEFIYQAHIHENLGNVYSYVITKFTTSNELIMYQYDITGCAMSTYMNNLTINQPTGFSNIKFDAIVDKVSITYKNGFGLTIRQVVNLDLTFSGFNVYFQFFQGIYLKGLDVYNFHKATNSQGIMQNYGSEPTTMLITGDSISYPIKYKTDKDQTVLIGMYVGGGAFSLKSLNNLTHFVSNYGGPYQNYSLGEANWQSYCIGNNKVFTILNGGNLEIFDLTSLTKTTLKLGITGSLDCFYDENSQGIFYGDISGSDLTTNFINLTSASITKRVLAHSNLQDFVPFSSYYAAYNQTTLTINSIKTVICQFFTFFNSSTASCDSCGDSCPVCSSSQVCLQCSSSYYLVNGFCLESQFQQTAEIIFNNPVMKLINRVPGGRRVVKLWFYFFSNMDDLWLYQYHERDYGRTMNSLFYYINKLQQQKWEVFQADKMRYYLENIHVNEKSILSQIDNRTSYSSQKFTEIQGRGQGFLPNAWFYLTINLVFVLVAYFVMRAFFFVLFHYKVSIVFRPFSFWAYIGLLLVDGNVQYFYFLFFNQAKIGFSFSFKEKINNLITYFLFYIFILFSISQYYLFYALYKRLSKYFFDSVAPSIKGAIVLCLTSSIRNFVLAAIHNFLRNDMMFQLILLISVEVMYLCLVITFILATKIFKQMHTTWVFLAFSGCRILLLITLFIQQSSQNYIILEQIETVVQVLLVWYAGLYYYGILYELFKRSIEFILLKQQVKDTKQPQQEISLENNAKIQVIFDKGQDKIYESNESKQIEINVISPPKTKVFKKPSTQKILKITKETVRSYDKKTSKKMKTYKSYEDQINGANIFFMRFMYEEYNFEEEN